PRLCTILFFSALSSFVISFTPFGLPSSAPEGHSRRTLRGAFRLIKLNGIKRFLVAVRGLTHQSSCLFISFRHIHAENHGIPVPEFVITIVDKQGVLTLGISYACSNSGADGKLDFVPIYDKLHFHLLLYSRFVS